MYVALHPAIEKLLSLNRNEGGKDCGVQEYLETFVRVLSVFGLPDRMQITIKQKFRLFGMSDEKSTLGVDNLESFLRRYDLVLGPELAGFSNLLKSGIENEEICTSEKIDFFGLEESLRSQLSPVEEALVLLWALMDVEDALSLSQPRVSLCIMLASLTSWICKDRLCSWLAERDDLEDTLRLFCLQDKLYCPSAQFINRELEANDVTAFSLWLLVNYIQGRVNFEGLQTRLVNNLLAKSQLGTLEFYEQFREG